MARPLGRYDIVKTLGQGGYSKVKLGVVRETGQKVAVKVIKKRHVGSDDKTLKQVFTEVEMLSKIQHPNVISLIEVQWDAPYPKKSGKVEEIVFLVMELASGGEIFDFMAYTGAFREEVARFYFQQLIAGMDACHSSGICHRDLKPENILLDDNFVLKIADFGFAVMHSGRDGSGMLKTHCGTRAYMAPEVLSSRAYSGQAVDIWAAGVILFIMIAGIPPFQVASSTDFWYQKIQTGQLDVFWELHSRQTRFSLELQNLINRIFTPNPELRITLQQIKEDAWVKGPVPTQEAVTEELRRRKLEVDRARERAREDEKRRKQAEARRKASRMAQQPKPMVAGMSPNFGFSYADAPVYRSIDVGGGSLSKSPSRTPSTAPSSSPSAVAHASSTESIGELALPVFQRDVARYTDFFSTYTAKEITQRLEEAMSELDIHYQTKSARCKIQAESFTDSGSVAFQIRVTEAGDNLRAVEFRKTKGSAFEFQKVFTQISTNVADIVNGTDPEAINEPL